MKYLKAYKVEGLMLKSVDMDYKYLCELKTKFESKGKTEKAAHVSKIIARIDEAVASGSELSADLIESVVNGIIDENAAKKKELKAQIKALDKQSLFLRGYSKRCIDEDMTDALIASM